MCMSGWVNLLPIAFLSLSHPSILRSLINGQFGNKLIQKGTWNKTIRNGQFGNNTFHLQTKNLEQNNLKRPIWGYLIFREEKTSVEAGFHVGPLTRWTLKCCCLGGRREKTRAHGEKHLAKRPEPETQTNDTAVYFFGGLFTASSLLFCTYGLANVCYFRLFHSTCKEPTTKKCNFY